MVLHAFHLILHGFYMITTILIIIITIIIIIIIIIILEVWPHLSNVQSVLNINVFRIFIFPEY